MLAFGTASALDGMHAREGSERAQAEGLAEAGQPRGRYTCRHLQQMRAMTSAPLIQLAKFQAGSH